VFIEIPEGKDPILYVWGELVPGIGPAAAAFSAAVYAHSTLPLREFEAARLTIARVNGCLFCLDYRSERDGERVEDGFLEEVAAWRTSSALGERERLAAEYAERFATDHHGLDEEFWGRMRTAYDDRQVVELTMCLGSWIAFGRLNRVIGLDEVCSLPAHVPGART
jgi:alkylhydroperoxidase family enzyme